MRSFAIMALALLTTTTESRAQVVPDFTGAWRLSSVKKERVLEAGEAGSMSKPMSEIKITQSVGLLTLTGGHQTAVYRLDGTPTTVKAKRADGTLVPATGRAHWDKGRLILSSGLTAGETDRQADQLILSFDANGNLQFEHTGGRTAGTNLGFSSVFVREGAVVP